MNSTSPLGLLGICVAFAVTAFLGGMAGSLLLGGNDNNAGASPPLAQATTVATRPAGAGGSAGIAGGGVLPGASGATGAALAPTLPPAPVATATSAPPTATPAPTTYTVVSGDNPTSIAVKLKVPAADQAAWVTSFLSINSVTANQLAVGKAYKLPPNTPGSAPAAPAAGTTPAPATTPAAGAPAATATKIP